MEEADQIWNRAVAGGGTELGPGDRALSDLLRLHSLAMNSGLLDAIERLSGAQLGAAEAGYRWMDLDAAADVLASARGEIAANALDDDNGSEALDRSSERLYSAAITTDSTIESAFRAKLEQHPEAFAKA